MKQAVDWLVDPDALVGSAGLVLNILYLLLYSSDIDANQTNIPLYVV